jgi:YaiO family outer membrane protein
MKMTALALLGLFLGSLSMPVVSRAQSGDSADDLVRQARHEAFVNRQYPAAIKKCRIALELSAGDPDIGVLLGRLYAWSHNADSARLAFSMALRQHPGFEDAYIAWADLESWNDNDSAALAICLVGLAAHPGSLELRQRRVRLLAGLHRYREARNAVDSLVADAPDDTSVRSLAGKVHEEAAGNRLGISYDFIYFDKLYEDPWHLASVEYSHQTGWGSFIGRVNYANRFRQNGVQFEAEAYPHISRTLYGYLDFGYSPQPALFPAWRTGASLYANLPHAFEADAGFRLLHFTGSTWLYSFSLGKYYRNLWFNARCYLVPGQAGASQSFTFTTRYYYGGTDDYYSLAAGAGIPPDDNKTIVQLANPHRLQSEKLQAGWRHTMHRRHIVFMGLQLLYQEYQPGAHDHQWDFNAGYLYRF